MEHYKKEKRYTLLYILYMTLYPKLILDALATVTYPGTKKSLIESEMVAEDLHIDGMKVEFTLIFPRETDPLPCV